MDFFNFEKYLHSEKRYSHNTISAYITDLQQLHKFAKTTSNNIITNEKTIRNWIINLKTKEIKKITINRKISTLKTYYKFLIRQKIIKTNPLDKITLLKTSTKIPEFIPENNFDKLDNLFSNNFKGIRDKIIIEILYLTGIRRAELINLKNEDIDTNKQQIKITGKRKKQRIIPINQYLTTLITKYNETKKELTNFDNTTLILTNKGKPAYAGFIYRTVKKYLSQITTIQKKSPHTLRHTFATHLLNNNADLNAIKELLGHANLSATQIYTHNTFEKLNTIYKQAHPRA